MVTSDRERDLSKVLTNVEHEMTGATPPHTRTTTPGVEAFAPQRGQLRNAGDSLEQIQQDLRRTVDEVEMRLKAIIEVLKRING